MSGQQSMRPSASVSRVASSGPRPQRQRTASRLSVRNHSHPCLLEPARSLPARNPRGRWIPRDHGTFFEWSNTFGAVNVGLAEIYRVSGRQFSGHLLMIFLFHRSEHERKVIELVSVDERREFRAGIRFCDTSRIFNGLVDMTSNRPGQWECWALSRLPAHQQLRLVVQA